MDLKVIKEFLTLAEIKHFQRASEELFISQSSLSKHIKSLEAELQFPLFSRQKRQVELSQYGQLFLPYAKQLLVIEEQSIEALNSYADTEKHRLKIGLPNDYEVGEFMDLLIEFQRNQLGKISIDIIHDESEKLQYLLENKLCDFIIIIRNKINQNISDSVYKIPLGKDRMKVYASTSSSYCLMESVTLEEVKNEFLMFSEESSLSYELAQAAFDKYDIKPQVTFKGNKLFTLNFVKDNLGLAIMLGG